MDRNFEHERDCQPPHEHQDLQAQAISATPIPPGFDSLHNPVAHPTHTFQPRRKHPGSIDLSHARMERQVSLPFQHVKDESDEDQDQDQDLHPVPLGVGITTHHEEKRGFFRVMIDGFSRFLFGADDTDADSEFGDNPVWQKELVHGAPWRKKNRVRA